MIYYLPFQALSVSPPKDYPAGSRFEIIINPDTTVSLEYRDTIDILPYYDFILPVTMKEGHSLSAISLGLIFPGNYMTITDVELADGVPGFFYNIQDSLFTLAWSSVNPITIANGELLLSLSMTSTDLSQVTGTLNVKLDVTSEFADESAMVIPDVVLQVPEMLYVLPDLDSNFVNVFPNPFSGTAYVEFFLESESQVKVTLCTLSGQELSTLADGNYPSGLHRIPIAATNYSKGLYLLKFKTDNGTRTNNKLIKILALPYIKEQ